MLKQLFPYFLASLFLVWWSSDFVFFWDTIQLGSKHAHFFYENGFQNWILPIEIDSGHPPVFGAMLAICWQIFGRSLAVSHYMMLPFLCGMVYYFYKIASHWFPRKYLHFFLVFCLASPVLLGQAVLVSPDIVLVFFFLMGIFGVQKNALGLLTIASLGLAMTSMRGMMVVVLIYLFYLYENWDEAKESQLFLKLAFLIKKALPFVPSGIFALLFLIYHYVKTGWIGHHADSPWANAFAQVNLIGFAKNVAILGWRMLDFAYLFLWGILFYGLFQQKIKVLWKDQLFRKLLVLFCLSLLVLSPTALLYKGLSGHRYLLPIYISFSFLVAYVIVQIKYAKTLFVIAITALLTGNLWCYPRHIAQGWDATLGHLPYYGLREKMLDFIEKEEIPFQQIGTAFPNIGAMKYLACQDTSDGLVDYDFDQQKYIFYSNVFNDFNEKDFEELEKNWTILKVYKSYPVEVILFQKKDATVKMIGAKN